MAQWKYVTAGLYLLLLSSGVMSQTESKQIAVSISIGNESFGSDAGTIVNAKIINQTGQTIKLESALAIRIMLEHPRQYMDCHRYDCFAADYSVGQSVAIPKGGSFEFEVKLADLYWNDVISAVQEIHRPKNMFRALPSGNYELSFQPYSLARSSQFVFHISNRIRVPVHNSNDLDFILDGAPD